MQNDITKLAIVYEVRGTDAVTVETRAFAGSDGQSLSMDIYRSPAARSNAAVVIVGGYPDAGFEGHVGCKFKDTAAIQSLGRVLAASGITAIAYENRQPERDLHALLARIDHRPIAVWGSSGHAPLALSMTTIDAPARVRCAVLHYGFTLDPAGATAVDEAARTFGFVNPLRGRTVDDIDPAIPFFVSRAGREQFPGLNDALDRFVAAAIARNLRLTFVNHVTGVHAFDLFDASDESREVVRHSIDFLSFHLNRGAGS